MLFRSIHTILSAHCMSLASRTTRASGDVPADRTSKPGRPSKRVSAVRLRSLFCEQMKRTRTLRWNIETLHSLHLRASSSVRNGACRVGPYAFTNLPTASCSTLTASSSPALAAASCSSSSLVTSAIRVLTATDFATLSTSDGARESPSEAGLSASAESSVDGSESSVARANRRDAFPERLRLRGWRRLDIPLLPLKSLAVTSVPVRVRLGLLAVKRLFG